MADSYDEATQALQQQQRDMLAAMAQAGTAGQQAYVGAQQQLEAQKNAAVQGALAEAARRGAPQGMQDSIAYQIGAPESQGITNLTQGDESRQQSLNATQAAGQNVIQEALANIPALRALSQRQAQAEQFKAQQQAQADQLAMDLKSADLQIAQTNAAKGGSSGDPLLEEYRSLRNQALQGTLDKQGTSDQQNTVLQDAAQRLGGQGSKGYQLLAGIVGNGKVKNYAQATAALGGAYAGEPGAPDVHTPHGGLLDRGAIESFLQQYYA